MNVPKIKRLEGLLSTDMLRQLGEEFVAGGDQSSLNLDVAHGMDKYVHLGFATDHPMAYRVRERKPDATLIYLKIDRAILYQPGVMFSTGVGYAQGAEVVPLAEACSRKLIDFNILYSYADWRDPEVQRKRRAAELCEILVPDYVALTFIKNMPND